LQDFTGSRVSSFGSLMSPDNAYPLELDTIKEEIIGDDEFSEFRCRFNESPNRPEGFGTKF
jgi:hypothetical protein